VLSATENLFKVNWFATGNKCSWDKSYEMLKENQEFKVVLNSEERSDDEGKQKFMIKIFQREKLVKF
jgi:hypothetical protein